MNDNSLVLDLSKVQSASFYYKNQLGQVKRTKPKKPTVSGHPFNEDSKHVISDCTMLEYATKFGLLDRWTAIVRFNVSANRTVKYTGDKAVSMWKAYKAKIFK